MCNLQEDSKWSKSFVEDENGEKLIQNIVNSLMPTENIRPKSMNVSLYEDNYTNGMSVLTNLQEGEKLVGEIVRTTDAGDVIVSLNEVTNLSELEVMPTCYVTTALSVENNYSRANFIIKESGVYKIVIKKLDANENVLDERVIYKSFSYSKEYDHSWEKTEEELHDYLDLLAMKGNGNLIEDLEDPYSVFAEFVKAIDCVYDPRFLFMILAITLFLGDIAVRKFKFKWLHEIIQDRKKKQMLK